MGTLESSLTTLETLRKLGDATGIDLAGYAGMLSGAEQFVLQHFGQTGVYAAYIALGAIGLYIISRLIKMSFAVLKFVVAPSVALAFVGSLFLPFSFFYLLPVTVSLSSVFLLFRG